MSHRVQPNDGKAVLTGPALGDLYASFAAKYPIVSIEDPFEQDDWANWQAITAKLGTGCVQRVRSPARQCPRHRPRLLPRLRFATRPLRPRSRPSVTRAPAASRSSATTCW